MPPPLVRWCLRLIVMMPLVALLLLLVLSAIHHFLSANAFPPVGLLFASWLLCHPCCHAATASCPFSMLPPPLVLLTLSYRHATCLTTSCLHLATCRRLLSPGTSSLVCLSFDGWFSHIISSRRRLKCPSSTPAFIHTGWLLCLILSRCFRLPSSHQHCHLLMCWLLTSHPVCLSFAPTGCLCV
jgi:hypothetical protein